MASTNLIAVFNWLQFVPFPAPLVSSEVWATVASTNDAIMHLPVKVLYPYTVNHHKN
jgi:hypothetical protein